ncbi:MAG: HAD family hydrolase [Candidatus Hodarchaeales archaeon]|jgi:HAD superfamily hydrolase (TIGR01549 family)
MRKPIDCIIFDVDGTLLDNTDSIISLFQDIVVKYLGSDKSMTKREVLSLWGPPGDEIFRKIFPPNIVDKAWSEFLAKYRETHTKEGFFSRRELSDFRKYVQYLAIFTGKSRYTNTISLEELGITDCFDLIYTGSDVENSKPYPDALFRILEDLSLNPEEVIFIGDSHLDIIAGKAAGVPTAGVTWGSVEIDKLLQCKPDYVFNTPFEFTQFIKGRS